MNIELKEIEKAAERISGIAIKNPGTYCQNLFADI